MGLPQIGVEAVVQNVDGYKNSIKAMDAANQTVGKSVEETSGKLNGMNSAASHLGNVMDFVFGNLIANAVSNATGALMNFVGGSIAAAREGAEAQRQLNAVLQSTHGIAGVTAKDVNDLAAKYAGLTKFQDNDIVSAQNLLLTFTKIGKKTFPDTTKAVLDMATSMKMDLRSAALVVGKAMNDPVAGVTSLQKEGVKLTEQQKQLVAQMVKVGDIAGAQGVILKELQTEFGGSAEAAATPWDILQNKLQMVQETIGGALIPVFDGIATALNPLIDEVMPQLVDLITNQIAPAVTTATTVFADFFTNISEGLDPLSALNKALFESGVPPETVKSIDDFANGLSQLGPVGTVAAIGIALFAGSIVTSTISTLIAGIGTAAAGAVTSVLAFIVPILLLGGAIAVLALAIANFPALEEIFGPKGPLANIGNTVRQAAQDILTPFVTLGEDIGKALLDPLAKIDAAISQLPETVRTAALGIVANFAPAKAILEKVFGGTIEIGGTTPPPTNFQGIGAGAGSAPVQNGGIGETTGPVIQPQVAPPDSAQVQAAIKPVSDAVANAPVPMFDFTKPVVTGAQAAQQATTTQVVPMFKTSIGSVVDAGQATASSKAPAIGTGIISGITSAINSHGGEVTSALSGVIDQAVKNAMAQLGIHSPSTVFAGMGANMMRGMHKGIMDNMQLPSMAVATSIVGASQVAAMPMSVGAGGIGNYNDSSSRTNNYYMGVTPYQPPMDQSNALQLFKG